MKKRILASVITLALTLTLANPAFAQAKFTAGIRQAQADDIIVKEAAPGALKKGKVIYLRCRYVTFEDGIEYEVVSGDGKIGEVSSENGIIKIEIKSESSNGATVIRLTNVKMNLNGALAEGDYPLELVTEESEEYPDNAFGMTYDESDRNFDTKYIVFDESFFTVDGSTNMENAEDKNSQSLPEITVETEYGNDAGAYVNDSNRVMIPVRFVAEALSDSAVVAWNDETKTVNILMGSRTMAFTVGKSVMNINGNDIPLVTPMEIKGDRAFLSLRDLGYAMGISDDKIYWDEETKTAYLNYKGE